MTKIVWNYQLLYFYQLKTDGIPLEIYKVYVDCEN